ncbi:hypothetical protein BB558_006148 [Smittium angustum]|uniref:Uncharacterized protein n=1 Tax=Smittium angustum TaxID=133377 RepID=A0A2U1IYJ4_SMIAN|nr:hypothetical protein BB558_006148 [Smittium angustum]
MQNNWRHARPNTIQRYKLGSNLSIKSLAIKGNILVVGYSNQTVNIFDIDSQTLKLKFSRTYHIPIYQDICPIAKVTALVFFCRECKVIDIEGECGVFTVSSNSGPISSISISRNILAIGKCNGFLELYNWKNKSKLFSANIKSKEIRATSIFPLSETLISVIVDHELLILQILGSTFKVLYSDQIGYTEFLSISKPSMSIWKQNTPYDFDVSQPYPNLKYCLVINFSNHLFRYFFSFEKGTLKYLSQRYTNLGPFGCLFASPSRAIFPQNTTKKAINIYNFSNPEFPEESITELFPKCNNDETDVGQISVAGSNINFLVIGYTTGLLEFFWFDPN